MKTLNKEEQVKLSQELEVMSPADRVKWAIDQYSYIVLTTSFGAQSAVMLHLVTSVKPDIPVIFIDTGYLFPETYRFAEQLTKRLDLNLKVYSSPITPARQEALYGKLWEGDLEHLNKYLYINKEEPMKRAMEEIKADARLVGLRRSQSDSRQNRGFIEFIDGTARVYPILNWTDKNIWEYIQKHELAYHPLWDDGYVSIGDWHSTSKLLPGMDAQDTRFGGIKRECGLNEPSDGANFQI